jgi:glycosyltransferase involved in cell wall biosynthesis
MKISFLLPSVGISGGNIVVFNHARELTRLNHDVTIYYLGPIISLQHRTLCKIYPDVKLVHYSSVKESTCDIAFATHFSTVKHIADIKAKRYCYFVQSLETRFANEIWAEASSTYSSKLYMVTVAPWLTEHLEVVYSAPYVFTVLNGIDKQIFNADLSQRRNSWKEFRILVEGPIEFLPKRVHESLEIAASLKQDFQHQDRMINIALATSSEYSKAISIATTIHPDIHVFCDLRQRDMANLYKTSDVLLKLSTVEGMFAPPLEAMHCGTPSVITNVTGNDLYAIDSFNAAVVDINNPEEAYNALASLYNCPSKASALAENGLLTASKWPSLSESTQSLVYILHEIMSLPPNGSFIATNLGQSETVQQSNNATCEQRALVSQQIKTEKLILNSTMYRLCLAGPRTFIYQLLRRQPRPASRSLMWRALAPIRQLLDFLK